ncbi:MAG: ATP-binding protein [Jaaginema sp. PMC 1079.18]|nr:ATP-binding protein [Jaaginema sp. PMC 1080.18]MEC4851764.1 ATP-binding protein [Jaaginema sp. PMC 1079.18]MEC4867243.1 ATP-binding protein [Jaaginema sp. PMC 1078.18]
MKTVKVPKRVSATLLNALAAGVVPRLGLEQIAIGRQAEIKALNQDLNIIQEGGAAFRFIVGRYGAGKSFLIQYLRNQAMEQGFIVADADLSPEARLAGTKNHAIATYRELMKNLAARANPSGGAMALILEKWISTILNQVAQATQKRPGDPEFDAQVEFKIRAVVDNLEGLIHGFDFANVIIAYWRGYREDNTDLKEAALQWLRGEFKTKTDAKKILDVKAIIDDDTWYDYLKLWAKLVSDIGYSGLVIFLDEAVHLYKISHARSRQSNYDKLLAMFNDALQGKAESLGILVGGTPEFIEDKKRGLYSDEAWRSRLASNRFLQAGLQDTTAPVLRLNPLSDSELSQLCDRLTQIHSDYYSTSNILSDAQITAFKQAISQRLGADSLLTPREVIRDLIGVLNLLQQNPQISFEQLISDRDFSNSTSEAKDNSEFAEFTL